MNEILHPARSTEFLSRLHDGETTAAERGAFDVHRASCEECRTAVETFERTLAAFRDAPTAPPAADLSARILRKIRAQAPARRPFGVTFGIDIRWAGVLMAALLVVLVSAPFLLRRPKPAPAEESKPPIRARILDAKGEKDAVAQGSRPATPGGERAAAAPAPRKADVPEVPRQAVALEAAPVEAASPNAAPAPAARLGLTIRAADGEGTVPALTARPSDERLALLAGREFVVLIESGGRVREVRPAAAAEGLLSKPKARSGDAVEAADPSEALRELVFAASDRPRRLLVRIE